jgi:pheromone alpha factor receptor
MAMEEEASSLRASKLAQSSSSGAESTSTKGRFASQASTIAPSEKGRKNSLVPLNSNMTTIDTIIERSNPRDVARDSTEVDLESMGVRVDRSYYVKGGKV